MANETLTDREQGNTAIVLLTDFIKRLLGKLTEKKNQRNDYEVMRKHQQALANETPSLVRFAAGDVLFRAGDQANCIPMMSSVKWVFWTICPEAPAQSV